MADASKLDATRREFADITGALEDAAVIAAHAQAVLNLIEPRKSCDLLIAAADACRERLRQLRRRLG